MPIVLVAVAGGFVVGSFLNVVVYRVPRRESLSRPRSHCPSCGSLVAGYDNIPVVSWVVLRGRCRRCKAAISLRYPAVEAATAALFGGAALRYGAHPVLGAACAVLAGLVALAGVAWDARSARSAAVPAQGPASSTFARSSLTIAGTTALLSTAFVSAAIVVDHDLVGVAWAAGGAALAALVLGYGGDHQSRADDGGRGHSLLAGVRGRCTGLAAAGPLIGWERAPVLATGVGAVGLVLAVDAVVRSKAGRSGGEADGERGASPGGIAAMATAAVLAATVLWGGSGA